MLHPGGVSPCVMSWVRRAQHGLCPPRGLKQRAPGPAQWCIAMPGVGGQFLILLTVVYREEEKLVCICLGRIYGTLDPHCTVLWWQKLASSGAAKAESGASTGTEVG